MKTSLNPGGAAELALLSPSRFSGKDITLAIKHMLSHMPLSHMHRIIIRGFCRDAGKCLHLQCPV